MRLQKMTRYMVPCCSSVPHGSPLTEFPSLSNLVILSHWKPLNRFSVQCTQTWRPRFYALFSNLILSSLRVSVITANVTFMQESRLEIRRSDEVIDLGTRPTAFRGDFSAFCSSAWFQNYEKHRRPRRPFFFCQAFLGNSKKAVSLHSN